VLFWSANDVIVKVINYQSVAIGWQVNIEFEEE